MNRVNYGNQITNGMQILSVGAVTASAKFRRDKADTTLNNVDNENGYDYTVIDPRPYNRNQISEQGEASNYSEGNIKVEVVDDDVDDVYSNFPKNIINTSQRKSINTKMKNDMLYLNSRINNNEFDVIRDIMKKQREEQE